jgi:ribosomal protein S12 methylthiotransferase accessory factor
MDCLGVPVFVCERRRPAAHPYAFGRGRCAGEAETSAYMEAIESFVSEPGVAQFEMRHGRPCEVSGVRTGCDPILEYAPKLGHNSDPGQSLLLVRAQDLARRTAAWVPAELAFNPAPPGLGASIYGASSNGLAAGNSLRQASLHALYELLERDIWSIEFVRNHAAWLDDTHLPPGAQKVFQTAAKHGVRLVIRYVPNDYGLPFFAAFLFEPGRLERRFFNGGWGCHHDPETALMRAVTEVAQSRCAFRAGLGASDSAHDPGQIAREIAAISTRTPAIRFTDIPKPPQPKGLHRQWAAAVAALRRVTDRPIYRLVYTPPESPLHVVRLIVPTLEHFSPSRQRIGPRMQAELEALAGAYSHRSRQFPQDAEGRRRARL